MSNSFEIFFNRQHPPPGIRPGEDIRMALARLRRMFLTIIPVVAGAAVQVNLNESVMGDGDLVTRLQVIRILDINYTVPDNILVLDVKAGDTPLNVTTDHIKTKTGEFPPIIPHLHLTTLPPGKTLSVRVILKTGNQARDGETFTVVSAVSFKEAGGGDYSFKINFIQGYVSTEYAIETAFSAMETMN